MIKSIISRLWPTRFKAVKTFSYYLPAPPKRKSGYQEKEFDQIIDHLSGRGWELLELKVQAHNGGDQGGVWIFCKMGALSAASAKSGISVDYQEIAGLRPENIDLHPDIVHEN